MKRFVPILVIVFAIASMMSAQQHAQTRSAMPVVSNLDVAVLQQVMPTQANVGNAVFQEGFEETTGLPGLPPDGWTRIIGENGATGDFNTWFSASGVNIGTAQNPYAVFQNSGARQAMILFSQTADLNAWLISPEISMTQGTTYSISFYAVIWGNPASNDFGRLAVNVGRGHTIAAMVAGTEIYRNINQPIPSWTRVTVFYTPTETGSHHIGFHAFTAQGQGWYMQLDDILVAEVTTNDLEITAVSSPFLVPQIPVSQAVAVANTLPFPSMLTAQAINLGTPEQTNVRFSATFNTVDLGTSSAIATLEPGAVSNVMTLEQSIVTELPTTEGTFNLVYTLMQNETAGANPSGLHTATFPLVIGNVFALDAIDFDGHVSGLGGSAGWGLGNVYTIHNPTTLTQVQVGFQTGGSVGVDFSISLFHMVNETTRVVAPIFTTTPQPRPESGLITIDVPETLLLPGSYFLAINQLTAANIGVATDTREHSIRARTVSSPTIATVGTQANFGAIAIRMVVDDDAPLPVILLSRTPDVSDRDVDINTTVVLTFYEDITAGDLALINITPTVAGFTPEVVDNQLIISHDGFAHATVYTVTIPAGTIVGLNEELSWQFRTAPLCEPVATFPWTEGFEETIVPVDCWIIYREALGIVTTWVRNTTAPLRPNSTGHMRHAWTSAALGPQTSWLITEAIQIPATGIYELNFWTRWQFAGDNYRTEVWVSTSTNDPASFTMLRALQPPVGAGLQPWGEIAISLEAFQGQTIYLAFRYEGTNASTWDIDDVTVQEAPIRVAYTTPVDNTIDIAIADDITLTFNQNVTYIDLDGVTVSPSVDGLTIALVNNRVLTISHDGLGYATVYTVTVPAGTIQGFDEVFTFSFRTEPLCDPATVFPWTQNFGSTLFAPDCWIIYGENPALTATWTRNTLTPVTNTAAQARHTAPPMGAEVQIGWLITGAIEMPATGIYELTFWTRWAIPANLGNTAVWISTTDNQIGSFRELHNLTSPTTTWQEIIVSLEDFAGETIYLAFRYVSREVGLSSTTWDVSNISIHQAPVRIFSTTPANNALGTATDQDIVVVFNQDVTYTDLDAITIVPAVDGFTPSLTGRTLTITHDGFEYATIYAVTIPAGTIVGLNQSSTLPFRTAPSCLPVTTFPWGENFAQITGFPFFFPPDCWKAYSENHEEPNRWSRSTVSVRPGSSGQARHTAPLTAADVQTSWLITPALKIPATGIYDLTFWTRWVTPANNGNTGVWISTTSNDIAAFSELYELLPTPTSVWVERSVSLSEFAGETIYLAFRYVSRGAGLTTTAWDVGDVTVTMRPTLATLITPADGAVDVDYDTDIVITFNQPVELLNPAGITFEPAVTGVSASIQNENTLVITHDNFEAGLLYRVTIADNVIANFGGTTWTFTTGFPTAVFPDPFNLAVTTVADRATFSWRHGEFSTATITLAAGDVWGDGSGYQMLLDNTATLFGTVIPVEAPLTEGCNISPTLYDVFSHRIPVDANPVCGAAANVVFNNSATIEVTPGVFDFMITNPDDVRIWIANGTLARQDNFQFVAGNHYTFTAVRAGNIDNIELQVTHMDTDSDVESFNVFLTDLVTPYATNVTDMTFEFTNLAVGYHIVGVQAVGPGGLLSNIRPFAFAIDPPVVIAQTPAVNATDVALDAPITVTFDHQNITAVDDLSGITFNPPVSGVLATIEDGNVLTITHDGFSHATLYTVTIPGGTLAYVEQAISWSFRTEALCEPITVFPWTAGFETAEFPEDCWKIHRENLTGATWVRNTLALRPGSTGHARHTFVGAGQTSLLVTPALEIPADGIYELNFWTRFAWIRPEHICEVWVSTTTNEPEAFTLLHRLENLPDSYTSTLTPWRNEVIALDEFNGETIFIAFRYSGVNTHIWDIDDISIALAPVRIASRTPDVDATNVIADEDVIVVFNQPVTAGNLGLIEFDPPVANVHAEITDRRLVISHGGFVFGETYTISIPIGALANFNEAISWSFEVGIPYGLEIIAPAFRYTQIPTSQFPTVSAQARNIGTAEQTNVVLSATLNATLVGTSEPIVSLAPLTTSSVMTIVPILPITEGPQTMVLTVEGNQTTGTNNTATFEFVGTENVFARDALDGPNPTGLGMQNGGTFATIFEVTQETYLSAIQVLFSERGMGDVNAYTIRVFPMTGPLTASTDEIANRTLDRIPGVVNIVDFSAEYIVLEAGRYAVAITSTGFVDLSFDDRAEGGWYNLNPATGVMAFNLGNGAPGLRMVIYDVTLQLPGQVALTTPANNTQNISITPTLTWTAPTSGGEVVEYFVYLGETATTLVRIAELPATETSFAVAPALPYNTTHYWRIVASNAQGEGEPSATWRFTTIDEEPTSLVETRLIASLQVFPNPVTDGYFYIEADDMRQIEIIDMLGRTVIQKNVNSSRERIDIPNLREGLYVVRVTTATGRTLVRIVVQ